MKLLRSNIFWIVVFVIVVVLCVFLIFFGKNSDGETVSIYVEGELFKEIPLSDDGEYAVSTSYGENVVEIKDKKVRVKSADCKNQICVETGWISGEGLPIICSPHKLTVEINGKSENDLDI